MITGSTEHGKVIEGICRVARSHTCFWRKEGVKSHSFGNLGLVGLVVLVQTMPGPWEGGKGVGEVRNMVGACRHSKWSPHCGSWLTLCKGKKPQVVLSHNLILENHWTRLLPPLQGINHEVHSSGLVVLFQGLSLMPVILAFKL